MTYDCGHFYLHVHLWPFVLVGLGIVYSVNNCEPQRLTFQEVKLKTLLFLLLVVITYNRFFLW